MLKWRAISLTTAVAALSMTAVTGTQERRGGRLGRAVDPSQFMVPARAVDVLVARPTSTTLTLSLLADQSGEVELRYEPGNIRRRVVLAAGVPTDLELDGLSPDRDYRYTVTGIGDAPVTGGFRTARATGKAFSFAVQADSHLDDNTDVALYRRTLANIAEEGHDFLVDLGDTFMTDKYSRFSDALPQYRAQRHFLGSVGRTMPVFLVLGNHDGETGWPVRGGDGMREWSRDTRTRFFPPVRANAFYRAGPPTAAYASWTWGDARFIVLDPFTQSTNRPGQAGDGWAWTLGRVQYAWLAETLRASTSPYTFVFSHHLVGGRPSLRATEARGGVESAPYFEWGGANADGTSGMGAKRPGWGPPIHDLLRAHHVTAVFHGHDHVYARQEKDGIAYVAVPQPGHPRANTRSAADYGYTSGTVLGGSGHLRVSVAKDRASVEFVRSRLSGANGQVDDMLAMRPRKAE